MKTIPLTQGYEALVDDGDFESLSRFKWYALIAKNKIPLVYAVRNRKTPRGLIYMHIEIVGKGFDHIDRNGINNQRNNLRPATFAQNCINRHKREGTSKFRGVCLFKGKWKSQIRKKHLGWFAEEADAALAYNLAAHELYGEFACYNTPQGSM